MDIALAYEAYCDFIDLIADDDVKSVVATEGLEDAPSSNNSKTATNKTKEEKKRYGLIGAISALLDGIIEFFTRLLGVEKGKKASGKIVMVAPEEAPKLNIQQIEAELMRTVSTLAKTDRKSPEFKNLTKKCEDLLKDFRDRADDVTVAARKYEELYGNRPIVGGKEYEANIGMTKKKLKNVMNAAKDSSVANREVVRYVSEFINTVKAIANNTQIKNIDKSKDWSDRAAGKALDKAAYKAEKSTIEAAKKSANLEGAKS